MSFSGQSANNTDWQGNAGVALMKPGQFPPPRGQHGAPISGPAFRQHEPQLSHAPNSMQNGISSQAQSRGFGVIGSTSSPANSADIATTLPGVMHPRGTSHVSPSMPTQILPESSFGYSQPSQANVPPADVARFQQFNTNLPNVNTQSYNSRLPNTQQFLGGDSLHHAKHSSPSNAYLPNASAQQFNTQVPNASTPQFNAHLPGASMTQFNTHLPNASTTQLNTQLPAVQVTSSTSPPQHFNTQLPNSTQLRGITPTGGNVPFQQLPNAQSRYPTPHLSQPNQTSPPYLNQPSQAQRPLPQPHLRQPSLPQPHLPQPHLPQPHLPSGGVPPQASRPSYPTTQMPGTMRHTGLPLPPPPTGNVPTAGGLPPPRLPPPSSEFMNGLPVPFHGQAAYTHQIGSAIHAPPTPEPNRSQKSSRSGTPVVPQNFDALEGGFTPIIHNAQVPQSSTPPTSGPPTSVPPTGSQPHGPAGRRQYPQMPGISSMSHPAVPAASHPAYPAGVAQSPIASAAPPFHGGVEQQTFNAGYNQQPQPYSQTSVSTTGYTGMTSSMANMGIQDTGGMCNLLQERRILPTTGPEIPQPILPNEFKNATNCSPDVFRCTLNAIPQSVALLNKARLPLGILIHPFKDLSQLPVIQSSVIVRCRSCRTYINPFVVFEGDRNWKCNLCFRVNTIPDEFSFDPVSKTYGNPQRRPEIKSSTIEFIAPSEYMLRPPQPAVYIYLLDVSFNAMETGYVNVLCETLIEELEKIPGDSRTQICFIAYDSVLRFFNLSEGLSQPQMLIVSEIDDVFLPCPDGLLVNLHESKDLIIDLLTQIPVLFRDNKETTSAMGAAIQAAYKLMSPTGGRVSVFQTILPTVGPGALQTREDPNLRASSKVECLGPATDFYKRLALDCSAQQIAVDMFMLNGQYADIATLACISKYSGGCIHHYPSFHAVSNPGQRDKFEMDLRRYVTRKIGFEAVMRIRCTKGLSIHTFHGNFFVRSTDLLSLPNINPDTAFGMQMSIEDTLADSSTVSFQAALLYTSSKGERRIRVHTLCVPVTNNLGIVFAQADQYAIVSLVAKMAVDRSVGATLGEAKEAMTSSVVDALEAFGRTLTASQRVGTLPSPQSLRLLPLLMSALIKSTGFRTGVSTKLDERVIALERCKTLPLKYFIQTIYPTLYAVHALDDQNTIKKGDVSIANPPILQLSSANIDRHGVFVLDTMDDIIMMVGAAVSDQFCLDVFDVPNYMSLTDSFDDLPGLDNPVSERLRTFFAYLVDKRPLGATFTIIKEDSKCRHLFFDHMIEDRCQSSLSYYEYLQHVQKQIKT